MTFERKHLVLVLAAIINAMIIITLGVYILVGV